MVAEDFRVFSAPFDDIRRAVVRTLEEIGARSLVWSRAYCVVNARARFSWLNVFLTGGEELTIVLGRGSGQVWVQSASFFLSFDFGINRSNCQLVLNKIADILSPTSSG